MYEEVYAMIYGHNVDPLLRIFTIGAKYDLWALQTCTQFFGIIMEHYQKHPQEMRTCVPKAGSKCSDR